MKKKVKYKSISFKISVSQKKTLDKYCKMQKTTAVKFLKKVINTHVSKYNTMPKEAQQVISKKQLNLFDLIEQEEKAKQV